MSIYEKEGGGGGAKPCVHVGGSGGMLPQILDCLRLLLVRSKKLCIE